MSEKVRDVEDSGFEDAIRKGIVLVDFWAPRCPPCRLQGPILDEVAAIVGDKASIVKLNVDENPLTTQQFSIRGIPALYLFKEGQVVRHFAGMQHKDTLVLALEQVAGAESTGNDQ